MRDEYDHIPFNMSLDCENLLKKLLVLNPSERMSLEVNRTSPFILAHFSSLLPQNVMEKWMEEELKPSLEPTAEQGTASYSNFPYFRCQKIFVDGQCGVLVLI